mmetsp:Transcript_1946/g.2866  ORF Transcript_1946/g.2866 Transcript_1946/m.2866 type:complete len:83 (-) Transcript_1946:152-400(-)
MDFNRAPTSCSGWDRDAQIPPQGALGSRKALPGSHHGHQPGKLLFPESADASQSLEEKPMPVRSTARSLSAPCSSSSTGTGG